MHGCTKTNTPHAQIHTNTLRGVVAWKGQEKSGKRALSQRVQQGDVGATHRGSATRFTGGAAVNGQPVPPRRTPPRELRKR
eukprot:2891797-Pyramimonas_sp.AAC.1